MLPHSLPKALGQLNTPSPTVARLDEAEQVLVARDWPRPPRYSPDRPTRKRQWPATMTSSGLPSHPYSAHWSRRVHRFATRLLHVRRPHSRRDRLGVRANWRDIRPIRHRDPFRFRRLTGFHTPEPYPPPTPRYRRPMSRVRHLLVPKMHPYPTLPISVITTRSSKIVSVLHQYVCSQIAIRGYANVKSYESQQVSTSAEMAWD